MDHRKLGSLQTSVQTKAMFFNTARRWGINRNSIVVTAKVPELSLLLPGRVEHYRELNGNTHMLSPLTELVLIQICLFYMPRTIPTGKLNV